MTKIRLEVKDTRRSKESAYQEKVKKLISDIGFDNKN